MTVPFGARSIGPLLLTNRPSKKISRSENDTRTPVTPWICTSENQVCDSPRHDATSVIGVPLCMTGSGSILMLTRGCVEGGVGTGTPGAAVGGGPGGHEPVLPPGPGVGAGASSASVT